MNFNCIFSSCNYKANDIKEEKFVEHLRKNHSKEIQEIAKKEKMPINMIEMITISNSKVFINS